MVWQGDWATRARIVSGLVLFAYVFLHLLNIGLGLISSEVAETFQNAKGLLIRSDVGSGVLYGALAVHILCTLWRLAQRRTLRMPLGEAAQTIMGLLIPFMLGRHIVYTRVAHEIFAVNDDLGFVSVLIWNTRDGWLQAGLILLVWAHGCLGLHYWLRTTRWWRQAIPTFMAFTALVPAFALAGFMQEGRRMKAIFQDEDTMLDAMDLFNFPGPSEFAALKIIENQTLTVSFGMIGVVAAMLVGRRLLQRMQSVEVSYVDGPTVRTPKGPTLLEMARAEGIPHTALCGGRGRCTTCRVMVDQGAGDLPPPSEAERKALRAVDAPVGARLACQLRPISNVTITRVFRPDGRQDRAHASQGEERELAILFLDMRGFTARTTGQLPYDIVFLLNRFFDAIVPAVLKEGGTIDKYLGDGLLAVFERPDAMQSAQSALKAAQGIGHALQEFNEALAREKSAPVKIGIGLHLGQIVLGEIGAKDLAPRTIIGDAVNAASRLEAQTKEQGVEALVSLDLLHAAGIEVDTHRLIELTLRGVVEPVSAVRIPLLTSLIDTVNAKTPRA